MLPRGRVGSEGRSGISPRESAFLQAARHPFPAPRPFDRRTTDSIVENLHFAERLETRDLRRRARARSLPIATPPKRGGAFMDSGMKKGPAALVLGLTLAACGGSDEVTAPITPPLNVTGTYYVAWELQVLRKSDGFQKQFYCRGSTTRRPTPMRSTTWPAIPGTGLSAVLEEPRATPQGAR